MGIFGSFKRANQTIEDARRDVKKSKAADELSKKRDQKRGGKK